MKLVRCVSAFLGVALISFADVSAALSPFPLIGTIWAWHATTGGSSERASVASPDRYTIELLPDGALHVRADCNRGAGRYTAADVDLRFSPIATTKIGCPAGSRDREFLDGLASIDAYRFEGIELVLATSDGRRTMRFQPAAR